MKILENVNLSAYTSFKGLPLIPPSLLIVSRARLCEFLIMSAYVNPSQWRTPITIGSAATAVYGAVRIPMAEKITGITKRYRTVFKLYFMTPLSSK